MLFGMIGNFYRDPRKDQMTLCKSLPKVFAEIENAHCIFAGKVETGAEEKFQNCVDFCQRKRHRRTRSFSRREKTIFLTF